MSNILCNLVAVNKLFWHLANGIFFDIQWSSHQLLSLEIPWKNYFANWTIMKPYWKWITYHMVLWESSIMNLYWASCLIWLTTVYLNVCVISLIVDRDLTRMSNLWTLWMITFWSTGRVIDDGPSPIPLHYSRLLTLKTHDTLLPTLLLFSREQVLNQEKMYWPESGSNPEPMKAS